MALVDWGLRMDIISFGISSVLVADYRGTRRFGLLFVFPRVASVLAALGRSRRGISDAGDAVAGHNRFMVIF